MNEFLLLNPMHLAWKLDVLPISAATLAAIWIGLLASAVFGLHVL